MWPAVCRTRCDAPSAKERHPAGCLSCFVTARAPAHRKERNVCKGTLCRVSGYGWPRQVARHKRFAEAKPWRRRNSFPPSMSNTLGVERPGAAKPKDKRPPKAVFYLWCERWDLNPHDLTNTGTSSLPVCLFQHARGQNTHPL